MTTPATLPQPAPSPAPRAPRPRGGRPGRLAFRAACIGLIAFNAWWLARDLWPVPDRAAINRLMARGKLAEAESALHAYLGRAPRDGEARKQLARLLATRGDPLGCAEQLHRVPSWWPGKRQALFLEGQAYQQAGLVEPAEAAYRACVAYDPYHPVAWDMVYQAGTWLVARAMVEERRDEARAVLKEVYREAKDVAPAGLPGILATRVRVEIERIEPEEAVRTLRKDLAGAPTSRRLRLALAVAEQEAGRPDEADRLARALIDERRDDPEGWAAWLAILRNRNDSAALAEAVAAMPAPVAAAPVASIQQSRGMAAESAGRFEDARDAYAEAVRLAPFEPENHFRLARVEQRLGHAEAAEEHRGLHRKLLAQRQALPDAYSRFKLLADTDPSGGRDFADAARHLAQIAEDLGWPWLASGLRDLVPAGH
jgi:tetratricopeptide (TPR) repeat protein